MFTVPDKVTILNNKNSRKNDSYNSIVEQIRSVITYSFSQGKDRFTFAVNIPRIPGFTFVYGEFLSNIEWLNLKQSFDNSIDFRISPYYDETTERLIVKVIPMI